jgi:UDP-N-acetylmuramate: L-alanyl-gamma-D-glutamyl-meso-diaminopimelate ligase
MKLGVNHELLKDSMVNADIVYMYAPSTLKWNTSELADVNFHVCEDFDKMLTSIVNVANENDVILVMSNGGFNGIHGKLLDMLKNK